MSKKLGGKYALDSKIIWSSADKPSQGFFPVRWEWGQVPCIWENSAI